MQIRTLAYSATRMSQNAPKFVKTLSEAAKPALDRLQAITRPFGFDTPTTICAQSVKGAFSQGAKDQRKRQLDHDIAHSPFYESKSFANTQGKIFTPPVSYFRKDKAKYFPDFQAYTLLNEKRALHDVLKGKVTLLRVFSTISGENCVNTYTKDSLSEDGYSELQSKYPNTQIVDVNLPQSWIKGLFVKLAKSNLRSIIPPARQNLYYIVSHSLFTLDVKTTLKCDNMCSGYLYLLDQDGKIRWATSGYAADEECEVLWRSVRGLEKELEGEEKEESGNKESGKSDF